MALVVEEVVVDSRLDPMVRARLALEDQCPTLVLEGVPTLVGRPQVLEGSLATGSLTANLTGHQFLITPQNHSPPSQCRILT